MSIANQIADFGEVKRGYIGVQTQDLSPDLAAAFGVEGDTGAVVVEVADDSPAAKAGLRTGDVIVAVNGRKVDSSAAARNQLGVLAVGERIALDVLRSGKRRTLRMRIAARPEEAATAPGSPRNPLLAGATFGGIDPRHPLHGRTKGVMVYELERGSPTWRAGLRAGDVVTSVNRRPVESLPAFLEIVTGTEGPLLFQVRRGSGVSFMVIK